MNVSQTSKAWYQQRAMQFEIIKQLKNKELCLLVPKHFPQEMKQRSIRTLRAHNTQGFLFILEALGYFNKDTQYNFYVSVAEYENGVPMQTMNLARRDNEQWKREHWEHIKEFSFFLDIDATDHNNFDLALYSAKRVKHELDTLNLPYQLNFSGCGFHFIIPEKCIAPVKHKDPDRDDNIYQYHQLIARSWFEDTSELIDLGIYDSRRVRKLPYTLAHYPHATYVCWNIQSDQELANFELENYAYKSNDLKVWMEQIKHRGLHTFNG